MDVTVGTVDHLSQVISHVVAPSFLLGAVAGFISVLFTRMTHILDRLRILSELPSEGDARSRIKAEIPRLKRRAELVNRSMLLCVSSGIAAAVLIVVAFASALFGLQHVWGVAILFIIALGLLIASLVVFVNELRIELSGYHHR